MPLGPLPPRSQREPDAEHLEIPRAPLVVAGLLALLPAPAGLPAHAWLYFALFAGVVVGLILEPLPGAVIDLIGVALAV